MSSNHSDSTRAALKQQIASRLSQLDARVFENIIFDLLIEEGLGNVSWRTPGPDGGRDIEGIFYLKDFSGVQSSERWFVECKRHKKSLDWPAIFNKIAYAVSNNAEYLLVATTSSLSPPCLNEVEKWNKSSKFPKIRNWILSDIVNLVIRHSNVFTKYFFELINLSLAEPFLDLSLQLTRLIQNICISFEFKSLSNEILEAASAVSELLYTKTENFKSLGELTLHKCNQDDLFHWLTISEDTLLIDFDHQAIRAFLASLRYISKSDVIKIKRLGHEYVVEINKMLDNFDKADLESNQLLNDICFWGNFHYNIDGHSLKVFLK